MNTLLETGISKKTMMLQVSLKISVSLGISVCLLGAADTVTHLHGDREHAHALPADQGLTHRHGALPAGHSAKPARVSEQKATKNTIIAHKHGDKAHLHKLPTEGVGHVHGNFPKGQLVNPAQQSKATPQAIRPVKIDDKNEQLHKQATAYYQDGKYRETVELLKKILLTQQKLDVDKSLNVALIHNDLGVTYLKLGQHLNALQHLQKALALRKTFLPKNHIGIATSHNNISSVYNVMNNYLMALESQQKVLSIRISTLPKNHPDIALSHNNIGLIYSYMGNLPKALESHQKALSIRTKAFPKNHSDIAQSYNHVGLAYKEIGNLSKSLENLQQALAIDDDAASHNNIGLVYYKMGNLPKALENYKKGLDTLKGEIPKNPFGIARTHNNIGLVYKDMGNLPKALNNFQEALLIQKSVSPKNHPDIAISHNNIGLVYTDMGNFTRALNSHQEAFAIQTAVLPKNHSHIATHYNNIGMVYAGMHNLPKALDSFQKGLAISTAVLPKDHPDFAKIYKNIAGVYQDIGRPIEAFQSMGRAFDTYLTNRDSTFSALNNLQKKIYLTANKDYLSDLFLISSTVIQHHIKRQQQIKAKKVLTSLTNHWLTYKGSILDSESRLLHFAKKSDNPTTTMLYQQLIKLKKDIALLYQKTLGPEQKGVLQKQLDLLAKQQYQIEQEIIKSNPNFSRYQFSTQASIKKLFNTLQPNELYIDFALIKDSYYQFSIDKAGVSVTMLGNKESAQIKKAIEAFQDDIQTITKHKVPPHSKQTSTQATMATLYSLLMSNIKPYLKGKDTLIISPDGPLRLLPFEALYDEQSSQYLIEQYSIRYVASAKEQVRLHLNQQAKATGKHSSVVLANPNFDYDPKATSQPVSGSLLAGFQQKTSPVILAKNDRSANDFTAKFSPLQYTQTEANNIVPMLRHANKTVQDLRQDKATEGALLSVKSPEILHIATHGFFNRNQTDPMMQSGLVMASANTSISKGGQEGIVYALDLSGLDLTGTELVVLSACNTGTVDPNNTVGISSLSKAFIQAGAKDVVMSLWSVADKETASLMTEFYKSSQQDNLSYSDALRQSKLKMIKAERHPFYWAPFILSGL